MKNTSPSFQVLGFASVWGSEEALFCTGRFIGKGVVFVDSVKRYIYIFGERKGKIILLILWPFIYPVIRPIVGAVVAPYPFLAQSFGPYLASFSAICWLLFRLIASQILVQCLAHLWLIVVKGPSSVIVSGPLATNQFLTTTTVFSKTKSKLKISQIFTLSSRGGGI